MISNKHPGISLLALVLLISGAVDSVRNLPATALFGTSLIFFFIFSSIVFLIPAALVSAELAAHSGKESGIFHWTRRALGDNMGFLAIWIQWVGNLVWAPTIMSFLAGTFAYFFSADLVQNKLYLVSTILGTYWTLTLINLKGITLSARLISICTIMGLVIPMSLIIALAFIWVWQGNPLQIHFSVNNLLPVFHDSQNWISLTAIMTAFLGIELAAVHVTDIKNPRQTFPKALFLSVVLILATMILGSLAIAIVLPKDQINLVNGVLQAFTNFFAAYHIAWITPIITLLMIIGTLGGVASWVISPARGLLQAAHYDFLPEYFKKENKHGVASRLLVTQAFLVSLICLAFLFMPSVNGSYWLLTALSTQLYILMYVIMFLVALVARKKHLSDEQSFKIPGGKMGLWITCLLGLIGCGITECVGFIPPDGINVGSLFHYEMIFIAGMLVMLLPVLLSFAYKNSKTKKSLVLDSRIVAE